MENHARQMLGNPWKLATIGIAVVITTALITGLVVANRSGDVGAVQKEAAKPLAAVSKGTPRVETGIRSNRAVAKRSGAIGVLEKAVIGGAVGAGVGAAGGAIAGGGNGAGKGAAIGGLVGATAGTLYGLHEK